MSKKLLEESTIRSFMKLANLQPLSQKFISENYSTTAEAADSDDKQKMSEAADEDLEEELLDEEDTDAVPVEEGKESEGRPSSPKQKVKGVEKPGKMVAAKNAPGDAKLKPLKQTSHHSDKADSVENGPNSNVTPKNNKNFELVSEILKEMADTVKPEEGMYEEEAHTDMMAEEEMGDEDTGGGAESGPHKEKMKGLIRSMLENLKEMGAEYGMTMEISDEAGAPEGGEEMAPPVEDETPMQEKLDEMVEKLTKRVAARLVKESKKKR